MGKLTCVGIMKPLFPTTPTQGYYPQLNFQNNLNYNYTTANGNVGYLPGDLNSVRLPDFHC